MTLQHFFKYYFFERVEKYFTIMKKFHIVKNITSIMIMISSPSQKQLFCHVYDTFIFIKEIISIFFTKLNLTTFAFESSF